MRKSVDSNYCPPLKQPKIVDELVVNTKSITCVLTLVFPRLSYHMPTLVNAHVFISRFKSIAIFVHTQTNVQMGKAISTWPTVLSSKLCYAVLDIELFVLNIYCESKCASDNHHTRCFAFLQLFSSHDK